METVMIMILAFFAIYGMVQMVARGLFSIRTQEKHQLLCDHRVIGVRNCADSLEGMVRSLVWEDLREELILLDFGSSDETGEILCRLEAEYEFLHVMTPKEYIRYLSDLAEVTEE